METKTLLKDELLWSRIQSFSIDAPNVDFPFSKKLAKEENWTIDFTKKAIEEYKKFVFLCCSLPKGASPSETVDKVWHMHLTYTQNYWEEFCPNILQQKLHHHPSTGGQNESLKHKNWFEDTLKNYQEIFQQQPPEDIWLNQKKKTKSNKFWSNFLKLLPLIAVIPILNSCSDSGGNFLSVIFIWIPVIFLITSFFSWLMNKNNDPKDLNKNNNDGNSWGSCSGGSSGCSSSCGSSCGGGCGGCGGGGD